MSGKLFNTSLMASNFRKFVNDHNVDISELPINEANLNNFNGCLRKSFRMLRESPHTRCFSYNICKFDHFPKRESTCLQADNEWNSFLLPKNHIHVLLLKKSDLLLSDECTMF